MQYASLEFEYNGVAYAMKRRLTVLILPGIVSLPLVSQDWPMWGGTPQRNMISPMKGLPDTWDVKTGKNIKWKAQIGSTSYRNPVVANGVLCIMTPSELYAISAGTSGSVK